MRIGRLGESPLPPTIILELHDFFGLLNRPYVVCLYALDWLL